MKPILRKGIALVLLFFGVVITWFFFGFFLPHITIQHRDIRSSRVQEDYAFRARIRNACHTVLRHKIGNHHDAFVALEDIGNKDTIPLLIRALKWQCLEHQNKIANNKLVPCTVGHCVWNLQNLTGMKFGYDYEAWDNWWKETGRYLPFDEEKGQLILQEGTE